ncbi:MAG: bifunctional oligoribonuclease/PAP phosphatase NrnA [Candidatus Poribacteria bacterium]|nr:bifunctional oligoribonuclease/PAP phosphatase NrnA [Candidatus Poribacteria bacterium]
MNNFGDLLTLFERYQTFAIATHVNPDGDAIGSELALYIFLRKLGKSVRILNTDQVPEKYQFLPYWENIENAQVSTDYCPEVLVIVDASSRERIGKFLSKNLIPIHAVVNIDHHITAKSFGDYNIIQTEVSSTAEIIYQFIKSTDMSIDAEEALCLYTGLMFDTGCFRYSNATPETHRIAADLIEIGDFAPDEVYCRVYEHIPLGKIHLLGKALRTLELTSDGKIAWVVVTQKMLNDTDTTLDDVEGFVNQIQAIDSVEVAICICELQDGNTKVSLRSKGRVDVAALAAEFNGGGHERASGCRINLQPTSAIKMLVESAVRRIKEI